jgi:hypothetical protein
VIQRLYDPPHRRLFECSFDASTAAGSSTISGIPVGLPSAVDVCPYCLPCCFQCSICELLLLLLVSLLNIAVFSTVPLPTFLLSDSGGPTAVDIHHVPIVPAAAVTSAVNAVPALFAKNPTFASITTVLCWPSCCCFHSCCCFLFGCCGQSHYCCHPCCCLLLASLLFLAFLLLLEFLHIRLSDFQTIGLSDYSY